MTTRISKPVTLAIVLLTIASLMLTACQAAAPKDLLSTVKARGVMRVSSDPNYKPQSFLNETTYELDGFDIDVSKEVAKRLGVKVEFVTPDWDTIVAANWGGRWDVSIGSMTITADRKKVLFFSTPYYYTRAIRRAEAPQQLERPRRQDGLRRLRHHLRRLSQRQADAGRRKDSPAGQGRQDDDVLDGFRVHPGHTGRAQGL
jgi:membrane-bound lytic murein transglycosylase MltF